MQLGETHYEVSDNILQSLECKMFNQKVKAAIEILRTSGMQPEQLRQLLGIDVSTNPDIQHVDVKEPVHLIDLSSQSDDAPNIALLDSDQSLGLGMVANRTDDVEPKSPYPIADEHDDSFFLRSFGIESDAHDDYSSLISDDVQLEEQYCKMIPLMSIKAACGRFLYNEEPEIIGWIDADEHSLPKGMNVFVVQAKGRSMEPRISDGDYCVFEYGTSFHEGDIILAEIPEKDFDYGGSFTIKKYTRTKGLVDGHEVKTSITLHPLNSDFEPLVYDMETGADIKMVGVLKTVIN